MRVSTLLFEATWRCSQRCRFCYNAWRGPAPAPALPPELSTRATVALLRKALRESGARQVGFTGGEPLLRPDLLDLVAAVRMAGADASVLTNGALLEPALARDLKAVGCGLVQLTLCGTSAPVHDALCGQGTFDGVGAALDAAQGAGLAVSLTFVATRPNLPDAAATVRWAATHGVTQLLLNRYNTGGCGLAEPDGGDALLPTLAELSAALCEVDAAAAATGVGVSVSVPVMPCLLDATRFPHLGLAQGCAAGTPDAYFTLDPWGRVRFCNHTPTVLGDLCAAPFGAIAASPRLAAVRAARPPFCVPCPGWDACRGGCRAAAEQAVGRWDAEDPFLAACLARGEVQPPG